MKKYKCFQCDHEPIIDGNWMGGDLGDVDEDDDFLVTMMSCPYCGSSYEVAECPESEKPSYPYYQETSQQD